MGDLSQALVAAFAGGFVVQRFMEICDPYTTAYITNPDKKKFVMGVISLVLGCLVACYAKISIFHTLCLLQKTCSNTAACKITESWDWFFSGIFISAGTEGFNSLMKFANYKKEASKGEAASQLSQAPAAAVKAVNP